MNTPLIAVFSADHRLASALNDRFPTGWQLDRCARPLSDLLGETRDLRPDALVVDFTNVTSGGHEEDRVLEAIQQIVPQLPIVMVTGENCPEPLARRAACTNLIHVCDEEDVRKIAEQLSELFPAEVSRTGMQCVTAADDDSACQVVLSGLTRQFETRTPSVKWMLQELEVAAGHDVTILLIGETGVGKTFLSRLIHEVSPRRDEPFITVACGALPGDLVESELFGHARGAFTSAHADKDGKFVAAAGGTVLLDEIDVLSLEQQVKLLRVIETGEFEPVGSNRTLTSRARLVVAGNLDLQPLVEQGRFRPDLYYRLNMLKFDIPALRDRRADIIPLAEKFLGQLTERHNVRIDRIEDDVFDALLRYPWPGNARELENVLRRAVIFCRDGVLTAHHLPPNILRCQAGPANDASVSLGTTPSLLRVARESLGGQMASTEQDIIESALQKHNHSRTKTAKHLGVSRVTLYNKMKKYGMV